MAVGDVDADGDYDVIVHLQSGRVRFWRNSQPDGRARPGTVRVRLDARVSNRSAIGAKVELRAGSLRDRFEVSAAMPPAAPADVVFGVGRRARADVVRVLWPSGVLQAEPDPARAVVIVELDRKPSSCPFLFTWNGTRFEFVTDFMGGGEMGAWVAPGVRNAPDPDEYVRLRHDQLSPKNGLYELRMTNELEEALFVDRIQLIAVAHASSVEVFPNEGLRSPGERRPFTLYTAHQPRPPAAVIDHHGHDMLDAVRSIDRNYADDFRLEAVQGYAEPHSLTLTLGNVPSGSPLKLLFTGWTDYAFSSDNVAAYQAALPSDPPSLQILDPDGTWRTIVPELGIPVGRPQTIVVDLTRHVPRAGGRIVVRVNTSMRVYWDQILMDTSAPAVHAVTRLAPRDAQLKWRGFSAEIVSEGRGPLTYDYYRVSSVSPWKTLPGLYTREGDVGALLESTDDRFVVSAPGDEIALTFDASTLPALPAGWTRTFLLYVDGFSKEMNLHSSSPDRLEPLPFHAMSRYPYRAPESYPRTRAHDRYRAEYNTRAIGGPLPPMILSSAGRRQMIRYAAAACQTDLPNPLSRDQMRHNTNRIIEMIQYAVDGSAPFLPVRLVVFPEFAHAAPVFASVQELMSNLAVPIPNEHTDRLAAKARELDIYIQSGTMLECDARWPGVVFNTTCLIGPEGILYKYRKVNPWLPFEVHASPHDLPGYTEPLFPVADTPIGRIGCAICYDWLFPEAIRQLAANGAEVLVRVSAYMDPWGATEPMSWWTIVNRCRALGKHRLRGGGKSGSKSAGTIRHIRGRAAVRSSISMGGSSPTRLPVLESGSSSRRSISLRCGTSGPRAPAIRRSITCGRKRIRCISGTATPRSVLPEDHASRRSRRGDSRQS